VVGGSADVLPCGGLGELALGIVERHVDRGHAEQEVRWRVVALDGVHDDLGGALRVARGTNATAISIAASRT
jgi:hypothetical protein